MADIVAGTKVTQIEVTPPQAGDEMYRLHLALHKRTLTDDRRGWADMIVLGGTEDAQVLTDLITAVNTASGSL